MRIVTPLLAWLLLLGASGCVTANGTSTKADAGDAGGACDHKSNCQSCLSCALANPCAALYNTCLQDANCQAVDQCIGICGGDLQCQQQCFDGNPSGVAPYNAVRNCLYCDECPSDCAGQYSCT